MSRDRLAELKSARNDGNAMEMGQINPLDVFQREVDEIDDNIKQVKLTVDDLDKLQKRSVSVTSESESAGIEKQLENLTQKSNQLTNLVSQQLQDMQKSFAGMPNDGNMMIRRNQHSALTRKFMALLTEYQNAQKRNRDAARDRFARQYRIANPNATADDVNDALNVSGSQSVFSNQLLEQTRNQRARQALQQAEERHRDIERIGDNISDIQQLFFTLQHMIEQQSETLDTIETNVNTAATDVVRADQSLSKAVESARAARRKRWCLFFTLLIIIAVVIIALLIYFLPKQSSTG